MSESEDILTELLDAQRCVNEIPAPDDLPQRAHDEIKRLRARLTEAEKDSSRLSFLDRYHLRAASAEYQHPWIIERRPSEGWMIYESETVGKHSTLREAIDAALEESRRG